MTPKQVWALPPKLLTEKQREFYFSSTRAEASPETARVYR
jgi:hypothetical protein